MAWRQTRETRYVQLPEARIREIEEMVVSWPYETKAFLRARLNQSPAGVIGIYLAPGANALETADNVKKILEDAKAKFPPDMIYDIAMDTTLPNVAATAGDPAARETPGPDSGG